MAGGGGDMWRLRQRREEEETDMWARAREKKESKFEIRNEGVPGLKNSLNFYWR
jgi:hypothetical protein